MSGYSHRETSRPNVSIIILNWNNHQDTIECLKSLRQIDCHLYDIVIVDNGSQSSSTDELIKYIKSQDDASLNSFSDGSSDRILTLSEQEIANKNKVEESLRNNQYKKVLIKNAKNYGFTGGNNIGAEFALRFLNPSYILFLNNDVTVEKHFLSILIDSAESEKRIGIVGPKIYYTNFFGRDDIINFAGEDIIVWKGKGPRYGYDKKDEGQFDQRREVDKVDGACMLIKREVLDRVGLFDPAFFAYWEETDLCARAKKAGYKVVYVPKSRIWHKIASSTGGFYSNRRTFLFTRNRFLFIKRNGKPKERFMFMIYFFFWDLWYMVAQLFRNRQFKAIPAFAEGILAGTRILL